MDKNAFAQMKSYSESGPGDGGRTGSWRVNRPVINLLACIPAKSGKMACFTCYLYCPDGVITRAIPPVIDYTYCKGCGICAEECPVSAIDMVEENQFVAAEEGIHACD